MELSELFAEDLAVWVLVVFGLILASVGIGMAVQRNNKTDVRPKIRRKDNNDEK